MEKTEILTFPDNLIIPNHYAIIATLLVLLDRFELSNTVISHCKMGFRIITIICDDPNYNTRTALLSAKEFDTFFSFFPVSFVNSRDLIPLDMIFKCIELCVKFNKITHVS